MRTIGRERNRKCNAKCIAKLDRARVTWLRWRFTWGMIALISFSSFLTGEWNLTSSRNSRTRTPLRLRTYRVLMVSTISRLIYSLYFKRQNFKQFQLTWREVSVALKQGCHDVGVMSGKNKFFSRTRKSQGVWGKCQGVWGKCQGLLSWHIFLDWNFHHMVTVKPCHDKSYSETWVH